MSRSPSRPEFFLDRSLGRYQVALALREAGWTLRTHHEVYGVRDEEVPDVEWLELCGTHGLVVLSKDQRLRYNPSEMAAIRQFRVKVFVLTSGNITARAQAERFMANAARIDAAARDPGSMVYVVRPHEIELVAQ